MSSARLALLSLHHARTQLDLRGYQIEVRSYEPATSPRAALLLSTINFGVIERRSLAVCYVMVNVDLSGGLPFRASAVHGRVGRLSDLPCMQYSHQGYKRANRNQCSAFTTRLPSHVYPYPSRSCSKSSQSRSRPLLPLRPTPPSESGVKRHPTPA